MLAMSTVLRREPPFQTIFGYALVFAEDGRQMHKSWGNAIEFDDAADRMGVDVMRWMFAKARPEDNILFGWHAADEARRELLILWNVYSFFITYARLAGWTPADGAPPPTERAILDRWILSRAAGTAAAAEARLADYDALGAARVLSAYLDGLSTWYLRLSRRRFSRSDAGADRSAAFASLHEALVATARMLAPILPFLAETLYGNLVTAVTADAPDSVHLTHWPTADLAAHRDEPLEASMAVAQQVVDLARTLREHRAPQDPPATGDRLDRPPGPRAGDRSGPPAAHRRRDQRQAGRGHRRRLRDGRAAGQAAAPQDRQAAGCGDPRADGRGAGW